MGSWMVWRSGAGGVVQFLDKVVDEPVVVLGLLAGAVECLDQVADVPVLSLRCLQGLGASDSVHRRRQWTFLLCNRDGYTASSSVGYGGDEGFFCLFWSFFALLQVVPELSASFWSPRWRRVLCHRGLPCTIHRMLLTETLFPDGRF